MLPVSIFSIRKQTNSVDRRQMKVIKQENGHTVMCDCLGLSVIKNKIKILTVSKKPLNN